MRDIVKKHGSVKVNTAINSEFATKDKHAKEHNYKEQRDTIYRCTDMREWYERYVVEPTLASFEKFQEHDSGWVLSRILNLW